MRKNLRYSGNNGKKEIFVMNLDDFKMKISNGEKLVILDDMVLDVSKYMVNHPGGKFVIEYNIGKDISKFFYGGY
jgi:cytochrome b involved in lipid metabolism